MKNKHIKSLKGLEFEAEMVSTANPEHAFWLEFSDGRWYITNGDGEHVIDGKVSKKGINQLKVALERESILGDTGFMH